MKKAALPVSADSAFWDLLIDWYSREARELPWRSTRDPYAIWLSEIMLQQTQVATVLPYYRRFLAEFPNVTSLASASESNVMRFWEGLGYYRRACQLHLAAKIIRDEYLGEFPKTFESILALPGVGRYTAGAICSFAYGMPTPIVEANTQRLYARLLGETALITSSSAQKKLWEFADLLVTQASREAEGDSRKVNQSTRYSPGEINQALMELGARICTPNQPKCLLCPLPRFCRAYQTGKQHSTPVLKSRTQAIERHMALLCICNKKSQWLLRQCGPEEHWAGLWDFPRFDVSASSAAQQEIASQFKSRYGKSVAVDGPFKTIRHAVTKYRIHLQCHRGELSNNRISKKSGLQWFSIDELAKLGMNTTGRKVAKMLTKEVH